MSKSAAPVLDVMGREITATSTIVYCVRRGSQMWLKELRVTQVVPGPSPTVSGFAPSSRKITLHNMSNIAVVAPRVQPTATAAGRDRRLKFKVTRTGRSAA